MNCQSCPHKAEIDRLRAKCLACNPESDGGTPHGKVKADEFTLNAVPKAFDFSTDPSGPATNLSPNDEHKLRIAMSSLFGLDPIDLMLVQHLMKGLSLESFGDSMMKLSEQVRHYRGSPRAMAWARKEKILQKMPTFGAVIKNDVEYDAKLRIETELSKTRNKGC